MAAKKSFCVAIGGEIGVRSNVLKSKRMLLFHSGGSAFLVLTPFVGVGSVFFKIKQFAGSLSRPERII